MAERQIDTQFNDIAIGDIGTQLFWFNPLNSYVANSSVTALNFDSLKSKLYTKSGDNYIKVPKNATFDNSETYYNAVGKFVYGTPVTAGAEFGGDTESFEAPETDLDFIPKIGGRSTLNDISYTVNYTANKYMRIKQISDNTDKNIYMEVLSDGSAIIFEGTSGMPTITAGDVRQITWTIVPSLVVFVDNIADMSDSIKTRLTSINADLVSGNAVNIDVSTIPTIRQDYFASKNLA